MGDSNTMFQQDSADFQLLRTINVAETEKQLPYFLESF